MRATPIVVAVALIFAGVLDVVQAKCACAETRLNGGWCDACGVGHVAGVEIVSAEVFEALDAHGHDMGRENLGCTFCEKAHDTDGFCEKHGFGFVDELVYFSPLTYELARGRLRDVESIECPACRENAGSRGWCATHGIGMIGAVEVADRAGFDRASKNYDRMLFAIENARRCEVCAVMVILDGTCPVCRITYEDGKQVRSRDP